MVAMSSVRQLNISGYAVGSFQAGLQYGSVERGGPAHKFRLALWDNGMGQCMVEAEEEGKIKPNDLMIGVSEVFRNSVNYGKIGGGLREQRDVSR